MARRLAAILAADVVGYSRLMGTDEAGTLSALRAHREQLIEPKVAQHEGRIAKLMGDGILAEFPSAVEAVQCAVEIQRAMAERNADVPEAGRVEFRVGVNLGDIIFEGGDIYGDGVNIAARLEGLAAPGEICISGTVHDHVRNKIEAEFKDLGDQVFKNIAEPLRVFKVLVGRADAGAAEPAGESAELAAVDKPSIAVLPLVNMSGDPEQEFFADGLTEDIITELSRFRDLFVISRNSAFVYKGRATHVRDVAKELGVQYVVEGSVRKAGNQVRVTVQLIDAETDRHVWAERYDRRLEDIFAIQDEVTAAIVATLPGRIEAATHERTERKPTDNMAAYECLLAGKVLHHRSSPEDNARALHLLDRAIALDPKYAHAHAWKACTLGQAWVYNWCEDREATWDQVIAELQIALGLDDNDSDVHRILAAVNLAGGDFDKARYHQERALSLNPNGDLIVVQQGEMLTWMGRPEEGIEWIQRAMRLNPYHPERFRSHLGRACYAARRYNDAVAAFKRLSSLDHTHHAFLAAAYAQMGEDAAAKAHAEEVLKLAPGFTVSDYLNTLHYEHEGDREHQREGLLKAGLPET